MKTAPPTTWLLRAFAHVDPNTADTGTIHFADGKWWHCVPFYNIGVLSGGLYVWDDWVHKWSHVSIGDFAPMWPDLSRVPSHIFSAELPMPVWSFAAQAVGASPNGHVKSNG